MNITETVESYLANLRFTQRFIQQTNRRHILVRDESEELVGEWWAVYDRNTGTQKHGVSFDYGETAVEEGPDWDLIAKDERIEREKYGITKRR